MQVSFTQSAIGDLESILKHYDSEGVEHIGKKFQREIIAHIEKLKVYPDIGRVVLELDTPSIRELIHPPFRIVYLREEQTIRVVRIWRSERLLVFPEE